MKRNQTDIQDYRTVVLWLDFYSQLLTDRTREVLELHYNEDMTVSEIAEHLAITRQGVHDKIRQGISSWLITKPSWAWSSVFSPRKNRLPR